MKNRNKNKEALLTKELINEKYIVDLNRGEFFHRESGRNRVEGSLAGSVINGYRYLSFRHNGRVINFAQHRVIFWLVNGYYPDIVDHVSGDTLDNRPENLRDVTHQQNLINRKNARGYYKCEKTGKWYATITRNGKKTYLGRFDSPEEARRCYVEESLKLNAGFYVPALKNGR